jgi:CubicO group peptidase (beta-lactamase class C family)
MKSHAAGRAGMVFFLSLVLPISAFAQQPPLLDEKVQQRVTAQVTAGVYPSLVIGMVRGDRKQVVALGSIADDRKREPDADTVYEIGSVTKTFTALLLADAVERGDATLEQPVQKLLPGYTIPKSGERAITLLDLATQSSGLPRLPDNLLPKNPANPYADYTVDELKQFLAHYQLPRAPGERYEYSNLGFGLLGQALAAREGAHYADLLRSRITTPLAMNDTAIVLSPRMAGRFAAGHDAAGKPASAWDLGALEGAGAVRSTVHDLLSYVQAHMHPPSGSLSKALTVVTQPRRPTDRENAKIGLAWQVETRQGQTIVWHNGMTGGYSAFVGFTADGDRGVVVLTNITRDVAEIGFAALLPESMKQTTTPSFPKEKALTPKELAEYAGRYRLAPRIDLVVRASESGLLVQLTGQGEAPVFASATDEFFYKVVDAQLSFRRDAAGKVNAVTLHQNGHDVPAPRVEGEPTAPATPKEITLDAAALEAYVGLYPLAPGFALQVTTERGQLFVQATAQPRSPVFASAPDQFFYKVVDAQLTFQRAADGSVQSVVLHQNGQEVKGMKQKP